MGLFLSTAMVLMARTNYSTTALLGISVLVASALSVSTSEEQWIEEAVDTNSHNQYGQSQSNQVAPMCWVQGYVSGFDAGKSGATNTGGGVSLTNNGKVGVNVNNHVNA